MEPEDSLLYSQDPFYKKEKIEKLNSSTHLRNGYFQHILLQLSLLS
jgi:hypothetical protein